MLSRPKLTAVLLCLRITLADLVKLANTLWSAVRMVDQKDFIGLELSFLGDPRWIYLWRGRRMMPGGAALAAEAQAGEVKARESCRLYTSVNWPQGETTGASR